MKLILTLFATFIMLNSFASDTSEFYCEAKVLSIEKLNLTYLIKVECVATKEEYKLFSNVILSRNQRENEIVAGKVYNFCLKPERSIQITSTFIIYPNKNYDISFGDIKVLEAGEIPYSSKNLSGLAYSSSNLQNSYSNDPLYNRDTILQLFVKTIKTSNSVITCNIGQEGQLINFFVYDLYDTLNCQNATIIDDTSSKRIYFKEGHIYHFATSFFAESFSNVAYLEKGNVKIFENVICKGSRYNIDSVINYLNPKLSKENKSIIFTRLKGIRKFGKYFSYDNYTLKLKCDCDPCN